MKCKGTKLMRIMGVLLCLCVLCCLVPMTAYALPGDGGYPGFTADGTYDIDGRPVLVYVTSNGGDVSRTKGSDDDDTQQYTATANSGWVFYKWLTYYDGPTSNSSNPNFIWGSEWCFSKPGDADAEYTSTSRTIQVNREWDAAGTYYLYAIFRPKLTIKSDAQSTVTFRCTQTTSDSVFVSGAGTAEGYAPYSGTVTAQAYIGDRIPVKVTVNNVETSGYSVEDGWVYVDSFTLNRPTEIKITTRGKIQNVNFDANGGTGSMSAQVFYKGEEQKLSANSFTKTDYEFKCWNTNADGSGDEYENNESVTFTPATDGESITLYAQWKHIAHTGGTATCKELAVCSVCEEEYGSYDKTSHVGGTELRNEAEAEEFKDGYTGDTYCLGCNDVLISGEVIPATHKHGFVDYKSDDNATCTEDCTETAKCEGCEETDTREIEGTAKGHSFVDYKSDDNATCTEDCTETAKCEDCEETDTREIEGTSKGHSFVDYKSDDNATCTEDCTETAKCEDCEETDTREIEGTSKGHSFVDYKSDDNATCIEDCTEAAKCEDCEETDTRDIEGTAKGHSFVDYKSDDNATCTEDCTETAKCEDCEETDTREIEDTATGHRYKNGKCRGCGKADPNYSSDPENEVPQTGEENSGMAVAVLFISFLILVDYNYKRVRILKK